MRLKDKDSKMQGQITKPWPVSTMWRRMADKHARGNFRKSHTPMLEMVDFLRGKFRRLYPQD